MARRRQDPAKLADKLVDSLFAPMFDTKNAFDAGSIEVTFNETAFDQVEDALEAEYVAQHGPLPEKEDESDGAYARQQIAMEAGYLIGVRVGMRLRR